MAASKKGEALRSVSPSTASGLEVAEWQKVLEKLGYAVHVMRTRRSYSTPHGAVSLWYLVTSAPMSVLATVLREATPPSRREGEPPPAERRERARRSKPEPMEFGLVEPMDVELM